MAVIHCALVGELRAIRQQMSRHSDVDEHTAPNGQIHLSSVFEGEHVRWSVRSAFAEQGNAAAAAAMAQAARAWSPSVALFVGVAGGVPGEVELGDVVAADRVIDYERGKHTKDGYQLRSLQERSAFPLTQRAGIIATSDAWRDRITAAAPELARSRAFAAKFEPIAAGGKGVASADSGTYRMIQQAAPRAMAIEMEGAGFLEAVQPFPEGRWHGHPRDLGSPRRESGSDRQGWQAQAAANAAAFASELLYRAQAAG